MNNILGTFFSFLLIGFLLLTAPLFKNKEMSRKYVHIGTSNVWFFVMIFFDNIYVACLGPILFIIVNYISLKKSLFKSIQRDDNSYGTVFYPISFLILTILSYQCFDNMMYGGIGMLIMGYGDGFASLVGQRFKSKVLLNKKTLLGTLTMFFVSCIVITGFMIGYECFSLINVLLIALLAAVLEQLSPKGIDNLTVPIMVAIFSYFIIG